MIYAASGMQQLNNIYYDPTGWMAHNQLIPYCLCLRWSLIIRIVCIVFRAVHCAPPSTWDRRNEMQNQLRSNTEFGVAQKKYDTIKQTENEMNELSDENVTSAIHMIYGGVCAWAAPMYVSMTVKWFNISSRYHLVVQTGNETHTIPVFD